jgi:hypothetical protein
MDLVGLLCVILLVADSINMLLVAGGAAKKISLVVTLVFLMAIALAAMVVFVLNTLVLPAYATDEVGEGCYDGTGSRGLHFTSGCLLHRLLCTYTQTQVNTAQVPPTTRRHVLLF